MKHSIIQTEKLLKYLLCSNNLDKYEHLIGEDLDLKPSTIEQDKFEYSSLGKILLWDWIKKKKIKRKDYLRD